MDDNLTQVLSLLITSGATVVIAYIKLKDDDPHDAVPKGDGEQPNP